MRILVDPEIFFFGRCGMVRYYSRLCEELEKKGHQVIVPLVRSNSDFISGKWQKTSVLGALPFGRKFLDKVDVLSKKWYYRAIKALEYDVILLTSPVFEDGFLQHLPPGKPFVMVVHDTMRCVLGPDGLFDPAGSNADRLSYLIRRAAKVICISETTRQDTLRLSLVNSTSLCTIYTGNLLQAGPEEAPAVPLPAKFLLFVGDRTGRKNFRFFIMSVAPYLKGQPDLYLVCTGNVTVWEEDLLVSLGLKGQVLFVNAPDSVLRQLYQRALALVYPSLYEGFGLPVLEAMALGCPVVTSTCGALVEVAGEAALYVDPASSDSILQAVRQVVEQADVRAQLRQKGLRQAEIFTVEKMVLGFEAVFQKISQN
ncbi:glycosyltransferase family 4 protein [Rufibacter quisquiliarum]|uniref:Glycosyltransferase involved in cell wall biosynthesis n=1 Tax=Rufibacter quisquiliarum TaxID=1549639 RepID=A0A839GM79_9BACT|nr:glycosyltransferase family 1 protein [Rufibacter quisquiliarum]MBA9076675.1 glycosyltransferase involved in cell wall biosynthesis [Rufibacter quisquiliarum]